jgi:rod shape-determining protein MreC
MSLKDRENMSELLKIEQQFANYPTLGVRIIGQDPSEWYKRYTIDKGDSSGLKVNMIALAPGGVVGRISECFYNYATVTTLMDESLVISAKCVRSESFGFVKGDITLAEQGLCRMDFPDLDAEILKEDSVITSSFSLYYPAGITIGKIVEIVQEGTSRYAVIKPAARFENLEMLLIVNQKAKDEPMPTPTPTPKPTPKPTPTPALVK